MHPENKVFFKKTISPEEPQQSEPGAVSPLTEIHSQFVDFVLQKLAAKGMTQKQLAIEVYGDEDFKKWRSYFHGKSYSQLTATEKEYFRNYKKREKFFSDKDANLTKIFQGYARNRNIKIELFAKILKELGSWIEFQEN